MRHAEVVACESTVSATNPTGLSWNVARTSTCPAVGWRSPGSCFATTLPSGKPTPEVLQASLARGGGSETAQDRHDYNASRLRCTTNRPLPFGPIRDRLPVRNSPPILTSRPQSYLVRDYSAGFSALRLLPGAGKPRQRRSRLGSGLTGSVHSEDSAGPSGGHTSGQVVCGVPCCGPLRSTRSLESSTGQERPGATYLATWLNHDDPRRGGAR